MTSGNQAQRYIRSIQRNLDRLGETLRDMNAEPQELRPHDARSELLEQVHLAGAMDQQRLFELLDQRAIAHTWIGAQVAAEYLDLWHAADGRTFYRVTDRAVRELHLGQLASHATFGGPGFADDWLSAEDSVYDRL